MATQISTNKETSRLYIECKKDSWVRPIKLSRPAGFGVSNHHMAWPSLGRRDVIANTYTQKHMCIHNSLSSLSLSLCIDRELYISFAHPSTIYVCRQPSVSFALCRIYIQMLIALFEAPIVSDIWTHSPHTIDIHIHEYKHRREQSMRIDYWNLCD